MNLFDAIRNNLNIEIVVDMPRYRLTGWFFQGESPAKCPTCSTSYKIFRCPYTTSKGEYKYWAVVCDECETASTLDDISEANKKALTKWDKAEIQNKHEDFSARKFTPVIVEKPSKPQPIKTTPKMYPPRFTRSDDPMRNAEKRFFEACRDQLGDDWTVLYDVSWFGRRNQGNERGDADFLLMHPLMGIFCVELKGGQEIFVKGNQWFTIPHGKTEPVKIRDPFMQAAESKSVLWDYIRKIAPDIKLSGAFGHFVVFPGAEISGDLSPSARRSLICDKNDMRNLLPTITRISNTFGQRLKLTEENISMIRNTLLPDVVLVSQTQNSLNQESETLEQLTEQQLAAFEMLRNQKEFVVTGGAGTGKTVLAFNRACALASQGARTLFLCHSTAAARHLRGLVDPNLDEILDLYSLDEFLSEVMEAIESKPPIFEDENIDDISVAFLDKALEKQLFFDALIVDEAQNIPRNFVELLTTILPNVGTRYIYIFGDSRQNTLRVKNSALTLLLHNESVVLDINCRSSHEIAATAGAIFNEKTKVGETHGPKPIFATELTGLPLGSYIFDSEETSIGIAIAAKHLIEVVGLKAENIRNVVVHYSIPALGVGVWRNGFSLLINPDSWEVEYLLAKKNKVRFTKAIAAHGLDVVKKEFSELFENNESYERQLKLINSGFHVIKSVVLPDIQGLESDGVIVQLSDLKLGLPNDGEYSSDFELTNEAALWEKEIIQALGSRSLSPDFIDESNMTANRRELFEHFKIVIYTAITRARHAVVFVGSITTLALLRALLADNVDVLRFEKNESSPVILPSAHLSERKNLKAQIVELIKKHGLQPPLDFTSHPELLVQLKEIQRKYDWVMTPYIENQWGVWLRTSPPIDDSKG